MTTTADLREIAVAALKGATASGDRVFSPRDLATWEGEYPLLIVTAPEEDGESTGRHGAPLFTVTATLHVHARVQRPAGRNDIGAIQAQADLEVMREQIKAALINYTPLMRQLQHYPFFRSQMQVGTAEDSAMHQGSLQLQLGMEFVQGPDSFYQEPSSPLAGIDTRVPPATPDSPQFGADIDLPT